MRIILSEAELHKILVDAERAARVTSDAALRREQSWLARLLRDVAVERAVAVVEAVQSEQISV